MGTLSISAQITGMDPATQTRDIPDATIQRMMAAYTAKHYPQGVLVSEATEETPAILDEDGNVVTPAVPASPAVYREPTGSEVVEAVSGEFLSIMSDWTLGWERQRAALAGADSVPPIDLG